MTLVTAKLQESAAYVLAMSILVLNLRKIQYALFQLLAYLWTVFSAERNSAIVQ